MPLDSPHKICIVIRAENFENFVPFRECVKVAKGGIRFTNNFKVDKTVDYLNNGHY